jgi:hypothetical protein
MEDIHTEAIDDDSLEEVSISSSSSSMCDKPQDSVKFSLSKYFCYFCKNKNDKQSSLTTKLCFKKEICN